MSSSLSTAPAGGPQPPPPLLSAPPQTPAAALDVPGPNSPDRDAAFTKATAAWDHALQTTVSLRRGLENCVSSNVPAPVGILVKIADRIVSALDDCRPLPPDNAIEEQAAAAAAVAVAAAQDQVKALQNQVKELDTAHSQLDHDLGSAQARLAERTSALDDTLANLAQVTDLANNLSTQLAAATNQLAKAQARLSHVEGELAGAQARADEQAHALRAEAEAERLAERALIEEERAQYKARIASIEADLDKARKCAGTLEHENWFLNSAFGKSVQAGGDYWSPSAESGASTSAQRFASSSAATVSTMQVATPTPQILPRSQPVVSKPAQPLPRPPQDPRITPPRAQMQSSTTLLDDASLDLDDTESESRRMTRAVERLRAPPTPLSPSASARLKRSAEVAQLSDEDGSETPKAPRFDGRADDDSAMLMPLLGQSGGAAAPATAHNGSGASDKIGAIKLPAPPTLPSGIYKPNPAVPAATRGSQRPPVKGIRLAPARFPTSLHAPTPLSSIAAAGPAPAPPRLPDLQQVARKTRSYFRSPTRSPSPARPAGQATSASPPPPGSVLAYPRTLLVELARPFDPLRYAGGQLMVNRRHARVIASAPMASLVEFPLNTDRVAEALTEAVAEPAENSTAAQQALEKLRVRLIQTLVAASGNTWDMASLKTDARKVRGRAGETARELTLLAVMPMVVVGEVENGEDRDRGLERCVGWQEAAEKAGDEKEQVKVVELAGVEMVGLEEPRGEQTQVPEVGEREFRLVRKWAVMVGSLDQDE